METRFQNRTQAGQLLAKKLKPYVSRLNGIVLGLPRGGVPVAFEVAKELQWPLDVCLVRKLGVPGHAELAMGAIALNGIRVLNPSVVYYHRISNEAINRVVAHEEKELERRNQLYRGDRPLPDLHNQTVILVDDGIATGATLKAAIALVRQQRPAEIIVAVPVAAASTCEELRGIVDNLICVSMPEDLWAIGLWYENFSQTTDDEVRHLLSKAQEGVAMPSVSQ